jgi:hypothetical protein
MSVRRRELKRGISKSINQPSYQTTKQSSNHPINQSIEAFMKEQMGVIE